MTYDVLIVGAGPAGCSAALTLRNRNHSVLMAYTGDGALGLAEKINNYPGVRGKSGREIAELFRKEAEEAGAEIRKEKVTQLLPMGDTFSAAVGADIVSAKALLLTIGAARAKELPGEKEWLGRGVSYCATCDGFLYKGKTIAVFCGAPRYEHEVEYLAGIAEKVYLSAGYPDCKLDLPNVEKITPIKAVKGGMKASQIELHGGTVIDIDGLFILRNAVAPGTLVPGIETDGPHIVVNRRQETNIPGIYAAGDCTGRPYQIAKAVGEGNIAAHEMLEYMAKGK